ncbi:MAG: hypothetical protein KDB82_11375 [Planctomycetes bacterium]|nr:hypothetical protein [Planctomycetota bacterium]
MHDCGEPLCTRDPTLPPGYPDVTAGGHARHDYFIPIDDWHAVGWYEIACAYGFGGYEYWDRNAWRRERYQRRKAWKRRES